MSSYDKCLEVKWIIKNFSFHWQDGGKLIFSPEICPKNMEGTKWRLVLSPKKGATMECVCVQLYRLETDEGPEYFDICGDISILGSNESCMKLLESEGNFCCGTYSKELKVERNEVLSLKENEFLPEDTLTVKCEMWSKRDSTSRILRFFAKTIIGTANAKFTGRLRKFSFMVLFEEQTVHFASESPELQFVDMKIYFDYGTVKITRNADYCKSLMLRTSKLYLLDNSGNRVECRQGPNGMDLYREVQFSLPFTQKELLDNQELYVPNDTLTFQYEITFSPGKESEEVEEHEYAQENSEIDVPKNEGNLVNTPEERDDLGEDDKQPALPTTFQDDMISFYNDSLSHDVMFRIGTETVPAHKDILRARSPVFKKMFPADKKEETIECIDVTDLNLDTFKRMLLFLYTDTTGELDLQSVKELYAASYKYDISSLKQRCSIFIKQNLQPTRVCEILVLADTHQDEELKSAVQKYIIKYGQEIFVSNEWKAFIENYSYLAAQVMYLKCQKN